MERIDFTPISRWNCCSHIIKLGKEAVSSQGGGALKSMWPSGKEKTVMQPVCHPTWPCGLISLLPLFQCQVRELIFYVV